MADNTISPQLLKQAILAADKNGNGIDSQAELDAFYDFIKKNDPNAVYHGKSEKSGAGESVWRIRTSALTNGGKLEHNGFQGDLSKGDFKYAFGTPDHFKFTYDDLIKKLGGGTAAENKSPGEHQTDANHTAPNPVAPNPAAPNPAAPNPAAPAGAAAPPASTPTSSPVTKKLLDDKTISPDGNLDTTALIKIMDRQGLLDRVAENLRKTLNIPKGQEYLLGNSPLLAEAKKYAGITKASLLELMGPDGKKPVPDDDQAIFRALVRELGKEFYAVAMMNGNNLTHVDSFDDFATLAFKNLPGGASTDKKTGRVFATQDALIRGHLMQGAAGNTPAPTNPTSQDQTDLDN